MAEQLKVSGPIAIEPMSTEFVAFKLLEKISYHETGKSEQKGTREYWLTLYSQCYRAAKGWELSDILKAE